jgi:hypothetical protein
MLTTIRKKGDEVVSYLVFSQGEKTCYVQNWRRVAIQLCCLSVENEALGN